MITNDARCTREIKSRIAMAKAAFNKKKTKLDLNFKKTSCEVLHLEHSYIWCRNVDTSESRSEVSGKFWNVVLENNGEDQLDRSCEK
jgi:hypothetical protein